MVNKWPQGESSRAFGIHYSSTLARAKDNNVPIVSSPEEASQSDTENMMWHIESTSFEATRGLSAKEFQPLHRMAMKNITGVPGHI